jgi:uncharacterized membrane protein
MPGVLFFPGMAIALWLVIPALRRIDPRREQYEKFGETFWLFVNATVCEVALMQVLTLASALGWPVDMARAIPVLVGLLFVTLGNYLPRLRSNWWMGIRTPWTLSNERVWRETHRLGGIAFVLGGLIVMASALVAAAPIRFWLDVAAIAVSALAPAVYSYVAWRRDVAPNP